MENFEESGESEIIGSDAEAKKLTANLNLKHFCPDNLDQILEESSLTLVDSGVIAHDIIFQDYFGGINNRDRSVYYSLPNRLDGLIEQYAFWKNAFEEKDHVKITPGVFAQIFNFQEMMQNYLRNTRKRISSCSGSEGEYLHPRTREFEETKDGLISILVDYKHQYQVEREEYGKIKSVIDKNSNNHKKDFGTDSQIISSLIYQRTKEDSDKQVLLITADKMMLVEISRACGYVGDAFPEFKQRLHLPLGAWMYSNFNDSNHRFEYKKLSF